MKTNVESLEQLFEYLTSLCKANDITLFGVTRDAERLANGILKRKYVYAVDFAVYADDYDKLLSALESGGEYDIESLENNEHMPAIGIRCTDRSTMYYDPTDSGSFLCNGIHLNIWPLIRRPRNGYKNKFINLKERFWERKETYGTKALPLKSRIKEGVIRFLFKLFGEKRAGRSLMRSCISRSKASKGKYTFHLPNSAICEITEKEIKDYPVIETNGIMMKCFPNASPVHRKYYRLRRLTGTYALFSPNISWDEIVKFDGIGAKADRMAYIKSIRDRNKNYIVALNDAMKYWKLMEMTYARMQYYNDFAPDKEYLMGLYKEGDYEKLSEELARYSKALSGYNKYKMTLCFDADFLEMALAVLIYKDRPERANKLLRNVKIEHMESVEEYLQREETGGVLDMDMCRKRYELLKEKLAALEEGITIKDNKIDDSDPDDAGDEEYPPFEMKTDGDRIDIYIYGKNTGCEPEDRGKTCEQEIVVNGPFIDEYRTDVEFNYIHFIIDAAITKTPIWQNTLKFSFEGLAENERLEYVGYGSLNYYRDKMALCYLLQRF